MATLYAREEFVNQTKGYHYGDSGVYEAYTDDAGKLYHDYVREYGRCTGKVYIDTQEGTRSIGWVFVKRVKYEDARDNSPEAYYIREVWVSLHDAPDTVTREAHYHFLK